MERADDAAADVLLVEDGSADAELALRVLRRQAPDATVHLARDGADALDWLFGPGHGPDRPARAIPRVILLDLKLPRVSGLDVLRRVRADAALRGVPVVVLTSSQEQRDLADSYALGANSFVVKPVDFDAFSETLRQLASYWLQFNRVPR